MRWRRGLAPLMALIALLALGLAAMKAASEGAAWMATLGSVLALLVAMVGARVRRDRAAWVGFSVFGQGYVLILAIPIIVPSLIHDGDPTFLMRHMRIDGPVIDLASALHPELPLPPITFPIPPGAAPIKAFTVAETQKRDIYKESVFAREARSHAQSTATWIGLAIQGLAFASLGAFIGHFLARTGRRPPEAHGTEPTADARR